MDPSATRVNPNPKQDANLINQIFFWWTRKLYWTSGQRHLELSDLYGPVKSDESERVGDHLEGCWQRELGSQKVLEYTVDKEGRKKISTRKKEPQFYRALLRAFWIPFFSIGLLEFVQACGLRLAQPILQGYILNYFNGKASDEHVSKQQALIYAGGITLTLFGTVFAQHHSNQLSYQLGMRMRIACSSVIYRKIMRLSQKALTETTPGQVVNLLSNDLSRLDELPSFLHYIWIMPIQVVIVTILMWPKMGYSAIIGVASLLVLTLSLNSIFTYISRKSRAKIAIVTDRRVQLMNELIAGIQVIKMYAWEKPFANIVARTRLAEMEKVKWAAIVRATYLSVIVFTERTILFITLMSFVLFGHTLTADITYVLATYFNILQLSTALYLPHALILCGEIAVSTKRITEFLLLDEISKEEESTEDTTRNGTFVRGVAEKTEKQELYKLDKLPVTTSEKGAVTTVSIEMERLCANWISTQLPPTLCHLAAKVKGGELCALIGPVGSGKSSFLSLVLGELPAGAGTMEFFREPPKHLANGNRSCTTRIYCKNVKISYASQEAWLFSGTVKENILFGQPYDPERYKAVTRVCALTKDFKQLPHGDGTLIGEGGSALSGGQRARVNLARAVYKEADIYLLDDPLSAVDSRVAKHLFNKCIKGYLHGKTRILVTHQLQFVDRADNIIVLDRGSVKMQGSYAELSSTNAEFNQMVNRIKDSNEAIKKPEGEELSNLKESFLQRRTSSIRRLSLKSVGTASVMSCEDDCEYVSDIANEEEVAKGRLSNRVYGKYFRHGGSIILLIFTVVFFLVSQVTISGTDYWVSYWTNVEIVRTGINKGNKQRNHFFDYLFNNPFLSSIFVTDRNGLITTNSAIYMYTFLIVACIAVCLIRSFLFMGICLRASRKLHNTMFSNVLQATMRFFNDNPSGRILNRFSKDVGSMDEILPRVMLETIQIALLITAILIMVVAVNYWMAIPLVILAVAFYFIRRFYLNIAQNIKRLEGVGMYQEMSYYSEDRIIEEFNRALAKSPVFSHVNITLNGLATIRSAGYETQMLLQRKFDRLQDVHTGSWFLTLTTTSAFGLILDVIACVFISLVCFSFIVLDAGSTLGGNVGLAISQSLIIVGTLQYGIRQSAEMLSHMTAVERILQYTDLQKEEPLVSKDPPPPTWPPAGQLTLKDVSLRYKKEDNPVLKDLDATIESGWKVGVVGRTGAGKSSLISVLFRLFPEGITGEIKIDGRDTSTLGFHELRSRISIIPQEPVIFSESLRYNLDPFQQYDDMTLCEVLREVKLSDATLDQKVLQSGSNFSVGQRQLICLARAILKNNRILVLDEATANIDSNTDAFIQETIREKFAECTVITIAHRLNTIIDSDRIIVMEAGRIVEFGCPHELLQNSPNGHFAQMVNKTGKEMARKLREQAEQACRNNNVQHNLDLELENLSEDDTIGDIIEKYTL